MRERPILFSGPMVRAILDGRKTMTRRVVNPQPPALCEYSINGANSHALCFHRDDPSGAVPMLRDPSIVWVPPTARSTDHRLPCPYGAPGDRLWVRETFALHVGAYGENQVALYRADGDERAGPWRPSIFMPRWASRLTLEVEAVRVERVQEITEADSRAEGAPPAWLDENGKDVNLGQPTYRQGFALLWNSINAKRGFGWDANPWVWVVTFKRVRESPEVRT